MWQSHCLTSRPVVAKCRAIVAREEDDHQPIALCQCGGRQHTLPGIVSWYGYVCGVHFIGNEGSGGNIVFVHPECSVINHVH